MLSIVPWERVDENDLCYNEMVTSIDKTTTITKKEKKTHGTYTYNHDRSNTTLNIRNMRCDCTNGQKRETYA